MTKRLIFSGARSLLLVAAACAWCCGAMAAPGDAAPGRPTTPAAAPKPSLDDELLKGLDTQLLDDLHDKPAAKPNSKPAAAPGTKPAIAPPERPSPASKSDDKASGKPDGTAKPIKSDDKTPATFDPLDESLREALGGDLGGEDIGSPGEDPNPLTRIGKKMRSVAERLGQQHSDQRTQREQQQIATELALLVKQLAEQQQQAASQGSKSTSSSRTKAQQPQPGQSAGPNSDQPAHDSSPGVRKPRADRPDPAAARQLVEKAIDRLNLPAKDREEMLQAPPDEFLPGYEASIRRYFERLVESESNNP